jgi:hypothetical protein
MSEESVICWELRLRVGQRLVLVMLRFHNLLNESASLAPMTHTQERMVLGALIAHKIKLQGLNSRTTCHRAGGIPREYPLPTICSQHCPIAHSASRRVHRRVAPKTMIGRTAIRKTRRPGRVQPVPLLSIRAGLPTTRNAPFPLSDILSPRPLSLAAYAEPCCADKPPEARLVQPDHPPWTCALLRKVVHLTAGVHVIRLVASPLADRPDHGITSGSKSSMYSTQQSPL